MKTNILKKLIAVLCAATISVSVISSTGAITIMQELSTQELYRFNTLNETITSCLSTLQKMKQQVISSWPQITYNQQEIKTQTISNISSVQKNITNLNKLSVPNQPLLDQIDQSIQIIYKKLLNASKSIENFNKCDNINSELITINTNTTNILKFANNSIKDSEQINITNKIMSITNNNTSMINNNNVSMNNKINVIRKSMPIVNNQTSITRNNDIINNINIINSEKEKQKNSLNTNNIMKNNTFYHQQDLAIINKIRNKINSMNNTMMTKQINNTTFNKLYVTFNNKLEEFIQICADFEQFAYYRKINDAKIQDMKDNIISKPWIFIQNELKNNNSEAKLSQATKLMDYAIKALNKFRLENNIIKIVPGEISRLKRMVESKQKEMYRLIECIKKYDDPFFSDNMWTTQANQFCHNINLKDSNGLKEKLKQAVRYFDKAIISMKNFDDGINKHRLREWQNEASQDVKNLLDQAINKMKNSPNKHTVFGITKAFQPLMCGKQVYENCWMHAIQNMINFARYVQNQEIVKNTGIRDEYGLDNVEKEFFKYGFSLDQIKNVGTLSDESKVLTQAGINHSKVFIRYEKNYSKDIEISNQIAKLLLIKHFTHSITPVLVHIHDDNHLYDSNNRVGINHAILITGIDIDTNKVVILDSNHDIPQTYSIDRIASTICNRGTTDCITKYMEFIFMSFTNVGNFNYDNRYHSWSDFKNQLLPAISKMF